MSVTDPLQGREIVVAAETRWDAIELLRRLQALRIARTYMIQNAPSRWVVYARPNRENGALVADLLRSVEGWLGDRGLPSTVVELDGREHVLVSRDDSR